MPHTDLQQFIDASKDRGAGDEFLASLLTRRGWPARDTYDALADWWERTSGVQVPTRRGAAENARDAFLYLVAFSTLATWACSLGSLWFQLIEYWLPDPVLQPAVLYNFRATVTWQMASILVALPVYLFVMRLILRESSANPERIESGVRKWLTYIALFLAATGVVCDLVCFVDFFLKGELTIRFVLKCATVLIICGSIFWYYLDFLRGKTRSMAFAVLALAGALPALGFGLSTAGMPEAQRHIEADSRRVQDLRLIANALHEIRPLPQSVLELRTTRPYLHTADPETSNSYEYTLKNADEFELCATFAAGSDRDQGYASGFWSHGAGRACYSFDRRRQIPW
jgi:hypothetical protein